MKKYQKKSSKIQQNILVNSSKLILTNVLNGHHLHINISSLGV
jgi:hypothetical protein